YFMAGVLPRPGLALRGLDLGDFKIFQIRISFLLPQIMLGLLLFNGGLGVKAGDLKHVLKRPFILLGGSFANAAVPLAFIAAASVALRLWHNGEESQQILTGLAIVASMPIAGASTAWAQNADGNLALSIGLVLLTTALSPSLTPAVLHAAGFLTMGDYSEDLHEIASEGAVSFIGSWLLLPSLLGILGRILLSDASMTAAAPYLKLINYAALVLLNYSNASLALPAIISQPDPDFMAAMIVLVLALCAAAFGSGYFLACHCRAGKKDKASLTFGLGMNNNGAGLVLASTLLTDHPEVMLPVIFYTLVQHLVAACVDFSVFRGREA
ncbi:MAG TPA: bile acid:sodium symporter, partial [Methylocella sp.]|nr:bile acid:sodium symporter [Methylocella sp.]